MMLTLCFRLFLHLSPQNVCGRLHAVMGLRGKTPACAHCKRSKRPWYVVSSKVDCASWWSFIGSVGHYLDSWEDFRQGSGGVAGLFHERVHTNHGLFFVERNCLRIYSGWGGLLTWQDIKPLSSLGEVPAGGVKNLQNLDGEKSEKISCVAEGTSKLQRHSFA